MAALLSPARPALVLAALLGSCIVLLSVQVRRAGGGTVAEEWLLDNSHVIDDQLREIEEDLPSGYLAKLPRLRSLLLLSPSTLLKN